MGDGHEAGQPRNDTGTRASRLSRSTEDVARRERSHWRWRWRGSGHPVTDVVAPAVPAETTRPARPAALLTALVVVVLSYGLMQTMLVPTLDVLQRELRTSAAGASWAVLSATLLSSAVITPVLGRLADRHGRRRVLLWTLGVYLMGTLGALVAPNIGVLIATRAVQGVSLALLPLSFAIIRESLPPRWVPFGLALTSGLVGGTAGVGLLLGGVVTDHASWRWLFVLGSGLVALAWLLSALFVPASRVRSAGRPDLPGVLVLTVGLAALLLGLTEGSSWGWSSPTVLGLFATAVLALWMFTVVERRVAEPVLDIQLLTHRPLLVAHVGALALGVNQFVFYVLLPKLAELPHDAPATGRGVSYGFGSTVTGAALLLLPGTLLTLPASWLAPRLERRLGMRSPLLLGLSLAALGGLLLALAHSAGWQVLCCYLVCGVGYGFAMAALPRLVNHASPAAHSGSANSVNTIARTLGGAVGSQAGVAVLTSVTLAGTSLPSETAFTVAFLLAAGTAALGSVLALCVRARP